MNRQPLINVPKEKKPPKPLQRKTPLPRAKVNRDPVTFNAFEFRLPTDVRRIKREGKRGRAGRLARKAFVDLYFTLHGRITEAGWTAPCQMTGREMRREEATCAHKVGRGVRRIHGVPFHGDMEENVVAALWIAHGWQQLRAQATKELIASPVNVRTGGVVKWSGALQGNLDAHLAKNGMGPEVGIQAEDAHAEG